MPMPDGNYYFYGVPNFSNPQFLFHGHVECSALRCLAYGDVAKPTKANVVIGIDKAAAISFSQDTEYNSSIH